MMEKLIGSLCNEEGRDKTAHNYRSMITKRQDSVTHLPGNIQLPWPAIVTPHEMKVEKEKLINHCR